MKVIDQHVYPVLSDVRLFLHQNNLYGLTLTGYVWKRACFHLGCGSFGSLDVQWRKHEAVCHQVCSKLLPFVTLCCINYN